jgi:glycosyltransferase involved in cell wall biosynthesis
MVQEPIRVLQFTNTTMRAGVEEHILTLLCGLDRRQFRLDLVCPPVLADRLKPDLPGDVGLVPLDLSRFMQLGTMVRFARLLRERRIGILHSHMFRSSLFASPIGWAVRVPVIIETGHGREGWRRSWWKKQCYVDRFIGLCIDYQIAVSKSNAHYLMEQKHVPERKIRVIYPGCDLRRFHPARVAPPALRRSLGFQEADPVLLIIGRLHLQKGHGVLLKSLPIIQREFPTVRLVCVGEGDLRGELEAQACALGIQDSVRFVGHPRDVTDWLALSDLTVLPSFHEGLPAVAIESLAAGRAVVATAVDGTPEVVVDGRTGLTVPVGDPVRLAEAIRRLLRDQELRSRLAQSGREWVLEHFSQERLVKETQELYLDAWRHADQGRNGRRRHIPSPEAGICS